MARNVYSCDCSIVHFDAVEEVRKEMPQDDIFMRVSDFFKVLGDDTRIRIIWALDRKELCVCDLSNVLGMTKSAVSHQLGVLRRSDLVRCRRDGKNVFYSLADAHVKSMFEAGLEHIHE